MTPSRSAAIFVIGAADNDAIRPGNDSTINNHGEIISQNASSASSGNDAIDFQSSTTPELTTGSATVNNFSDGTIIGARHGITGKFAITVNNDGTITGQLGSGINLDTVSGTTDVVNHGTISGTSGGTQDGDGIDVDYLLSLDNYGSVQAFGTSTGNLSEAVTIGGGTINNYATGVIQSVQRAITVDDSNDGNAPASTTIYNEGSIIGGNGEAISITDTLIDTITNKGIITWQRQPRRRRRLLQRLHRINLDRAARRRRRPRHAESTRNRQGYLRRGNQFRSVGRRGWHLEVFR
jgi:hypothetical protein